MWCVEPHSGSHLTVAQVDVLNEFLESAALSSEKQESQQECEVVVSSIHAAKGAEDPASTIAGFVCFTCSRCVVLLCVCWQGWSGLACLLLG